MERRWFVILVLTSLTVLVAAACGRVDLEDLTPEAVKTEEAADAVTQTALAESAGEFLGDPARGRTTWDTWCVGCHAQTGSGLGPDIRGTLYLWPEWEAFMREGVKADGSLTHEANGRTITYLPTDLTDENFFNVFAFIAQPPT
jgi:mono/diheme cytochrome c family protein